VWYLLVIDRLRALFRNLEDAQLMSWHASAEHKKDDGKLRHPSNGKQWKHFDAKFLKFGDEVRNVRFALSTNGMICSVTSAAPTVRIPDEPRGG
jgi:hypothetical protein